MLNQKNTDNILYNKPYQLVLWTISTKGKCTSVQSPLPAGADREGEASSPLQPLISLHCWASVWSKIERTVDLKLIISKVVEHHSWNMIISHHKISLSFK